MSAANEDFDSEEHYISSLFITCDSWCFSVRWVCVRLVTCRFRDCHSDLCQIFLFEIKLSLFGSVPVLQPIMVPRCSWWIWVGKSGMTP